jgi:hypothetical protein
MKRLDQGRLDKMANELSDIQSRIRTLDIENRTLQKTILSQHVKLADLRAENRAKRLLLAKHEIVFNEKTFV